VSFSPDGEWLVTGEDQGTVRLWSARPLRQVAELGRHKARVKSVAFSPDGREVVSAGGDQTVCFWAGDRAHMITRLGPPQPARAFSRFLAGRKTNCFRRTRSFSATLHAASRVVGLAVY